MTTSMVTLALASLFFVAPGKTAPTKKSSALNPAAAKSATLKKGKTKPTKSQSANLTSNNLDQVQPSPKFKPLLPKSALIKQAKKAKIVPTGGDSSLTTLATLSAGNARQGDFTIDFRCAFVHTYPSSGPNGFALWPNRLIEFCRSETPWYDPGVEINFPGEAGRAYAVDCDSQANTRWRIKHRVAGGAWSSEITTTTGTPTDFVLADQDGEISVRIEFDPADNHILQQGIRYCRVSRIG